VYRRAYDARAPFRRRVSPSPAGPDGDPPRGAKVRKPRARKPATKGAPRDR
jgi:hypothetical protein